MISLGLFLRVRPMKDRHQIAPDEANAGTTAFLGLTPRRDQKGFDPGPFQRHRRWLGKNGLQRFAVL
uniref:Uncharacterized protein n=1 Tax=mine drainage metagenome TaxID=410659 RepID=E6QPF9_9ZZZZ